MRKYHVIYRGKSRTIEASAPYVARTFATHWLRLDDVVPPDEDFNPAEIAVIDPDEAGYGKHMGHCQGCKPTEMCSRSGTTMVEHIESTWSRLQQEELDKVHEIWCRRATDKGERK